MTRAGETFDRFFDFFSDRRHARNTLAAAGAGVLVLAGISAEFIHPTGQVQALVWGTVGIGLEATAFTQPNRTSLQPEQQPPQLS